MNNEITTQLSEFLVRFSKANNLPEEWAERFRNTFVRWISETSEQVKDELFSCLQELERSRKKPGRARKFLSALMQEFIKRLAKDPGGKSRYHWADKAYRMRQELGLDYKYIYPAVCKEATGKPFHELSPDEQQEFEEQVRSLVYTRKHEAYRKMKKPAEVS